MLSVIYDQDQQKAWLAKVLDLHMARFSELSGSADEETKTKAVKCLAACALPMLMRFKSPVFREEREWRFVHLEMPAHEDLNDLHFVDSGGFMRPFRTLLHGRRGGDERLPLMQVIAGASRSDLQSVKSAWLMVRRFGYGDVPIAYSDVPLAT